MDMPLNTFRQLLNKLASSVVREDYEEHLMHLSQFFEFVKEQYAKLDQTGRIPLDKLL